MSRNTKLYVCASLLLGYALVMVNGIFAGDDCFYQRVFLPILNSPLAQVNNAQAAMKYEALIKNGLPLAAIFMHSLNSKELVRCC